MKLLYYSPASYGGIADYAHKQANALVDRGWEVTLLSTPEYPTNRGEEYQVISLLEEFSDNKNKLAKAIDFATVTISNMRKLTRHIQQNNFQYVLLGSYIEYFAPFWSNSLKQLADRGTVFGAIVHDPVRNFVVGPNWWHRWSIACGYSYLQTAFVHEAITLDTIKPMKELETIVIPHGTFSFSAPNQTRSETRKSLKLPLDAKVMLAFGHIRNGKNLDLIIRALTDFPDLYLLVAGKEQSSGQKPVTYYQNLAREVGLSDRCRWLNEFIPDTEVANLFAASDLVVLTYSSDFHSASGVLNTAVYYRKPCLASSGNSPLKTVVQKYKLGVWVQPDSLNSVKQGIELWLKSPPDPQWQKYFSDNSWDRNAQLVCDRFTNHGITTKKNN